MTGENLDIRILRPGELTWPVLEAMENLQQRVWQFADRGPCYPARLYKVQAAIGGTPLAAMAGDECVGFLLGLAAHDGEGPFVWSQIMGVHPEWRGRGIAGRLKWAQRECALALGVERIEWTFDPLEGANSVFNLGRLGAVGVAYEREVYGGAGGPLFALPADRVRVRWLLRDPRVEAASRGEYPLPAGSEAPQVVRTGPGAGGFPAALGVELDLAEEYLLVPIPAAIQELLAAEDRGEGLAPAERFPGGWAWRLALRQVLEHYLSRGYALAGAWSRDGEYRQVLHRRGGCHLRSKG